MTEPKVDVENQPADEANDIAKKMEEAAAKAKAERTADSGEDKQPPPPGIPQADKENERKRSAVRRWVTYIVIWTYCGLGSFLVFWLLWTGRVELALGVFGGIAGTAGAITGFWFGSRRPSQPGQTTGS